MLTVLFRRYHFHFLSVKANLNDLSIVLSGRRWSRTTRARRQLIYSQSRYPYGISTHIAFRRFATLGKDLFKMLSRVSFGVTMLTQRDLRIRIREYAFLTLFLSQVQRLGLNSFIYSTSLSLVSEFQFRIFLILENMQKINTKGRI